MNFKNTPWRLQTKHRIIFFYVFIFQCLLFVDITWAGDYSIAKDTCAIYDTCKEHRDFFRTCSCDSDCSKYGICCWDSKWADAYAKQNFECRTSLVPQPIFTKTSCDSTYDMDMDVKRSCESDQKDWSDLMSNVLVSSNKTFVTYKNWDCAICNYEKTDDLWFWVVQASYPFKDVKRRLNLPDFHKSFAYDDDLQEWGVYDVDGSFIKSPIEFYQPSHLLGDLKYCAGDVTSDCSKYFEDQNVIEKCHSFYGERKLKDSKRYFKNVYCALCNGFDLSDLECFGRNYRSSFPHGDILVMRVIYNLNPWTGEHLANQLSCPDFHRYDPFLKKCRSLKCGLKKSCENSSSLSEGTSLIFSFYIAIFMFVLHLVVV